VGSAVGPRRGPIPGLNIARTDDESCDSGCEDGTILDRDNIDSEDLPGTG
jgi:hypothetical protein